MFFAYHVFWPDGFAGQFEIMAVAISVAAFIALFRFKAGIIPMVFACAIFGLLYHELIARWIS